MLTHLAYCNHLCTLCRFGRAHPRMRLPYTDSTTCNARLLSHRREATCEVHTGAQRAPAQRTSQSSGWLYKGRHSSVFACKDADGQPVVLKCYHKALLERRHYRNVRREIDAMQAATEHR